MADIDDRWYRTVKGPDGQLQRVPSTRHGKGMRWDVRWRDDRDRQRHKAHERKADAERFAAQVTADLARGAYLDPNAGKVKLRAYGEQWFAAQTFDATTREGVEIRLRLHVYPMLGDKELRALRPSTIQAWMRNLQLKKSPGYVRIIFANLSAILQAAVDDTLISKNPCRAASVKPPSLSKSRVRPWTKDQVQAVTDALQPCNRAMVVAGAGLGMRQGEIFGLAVEDIDWLRGVVHVRRQVKIVGGKPVFAPPKGGKERDVPLPKSVSFRLAAHLKEWPAAAVTLPWLPTGKPMTVRLLFVSRARTPFLRNSYNMRQWKPALKTAGVEQTRENGMHALRHYYASVLLEDGVSIKVLSAYLGHADPGFTLRVYTHLMPSSEDRTRVAVDRAFGEPEAPGAPHVRQELPGTAS